VTALIAAICGLFGLIVGSFLNVVIWRVPRQESVVTPPSHCPGCDTPIAPYDNIPVLSWLVLRGRCRHCGTSISARYPLIELLTAALFVAVGARFADSWVLPAYLVLTAGLIAISVIDLEHFLIPNRVLYPTGFISGALLVVGSGLEDEWGALGRAVLGALCAFAFFFALHVIVPRGMGFGDVRLSFLLGLFLGWLGWAELFGGLFMGFLLGAIVGGALIAIGKRGRRQQIPFGPFLAAGTMIFILVGEPIIDWYTGLTGA
jgi:leader peptidase (prepilin peptidase)/N-methyltransferase